MTPELLSRTWFVRYYRVNSCADAIAVDCRSVAMARIGRLERSQGRGAQAPVPPAAAGAPSERDVLDRYCVTCHSDRLKTSGLSLEKLDSSKADASPDIWENVARKLQARSMPPQGARRPDEATYRALEAALETRLDAAGGGASQSRRADPPPAEPQRVRERDSRSARARRRRHVAPAAGRLRRTGSTTSPTCWASRRRCRSDISRPPRRSRRLRSAIPTSPPAATRSASARTCRRISTSKDCRSARSAARRCATRSRSTATTCSR